MVYNPNIPNQANLVRTASGDLALMQGNFSALAPVVSGMAVSGTLPSAAIQGFYFGDDTNRKRYFLQSDGSDVFTLQRNLSGESAPDWQAVMTVTQVSGEDITLAWKVSGVTPTDDAHLATKAYVDTAPTLSGLADTDISGPTSGQIPEWDGTDWVNVNHAHALNDLSDVSLPSPASGEVLTYNGAQWEAASGGSGGSESLSGLTDTSISAPVSGQHLTWDGTDWVNTDLASGNRVICVLSGAQTQTIPQSTATVFSGDVVPFNQGGFTAASGAITVPDGISRVDVEAEVSWASTSQGTNYEVQIILNGASLSGLANYNLYARDRRRKSTTADICHQNVIALDLPVASGDIIEMAVYQDGNGGGLDIDAGTGLLVREASGGGAAGGGGGGGSSTLSGLTDTAISGPTSGQTLQWDGSDWANVAGGGGGGSNVSGIIANKLDSTHTPVGLWLFEQDMTDETAGSFDLSVAAGTERYTNVNGLYGFKFDGSTHLENTTSGSDLAVSGDLTVEVIYAPQDVDGTLVFYGSAGETWDTNDLYIFRLNPTNDTLEYAAEEGEGVDIDYAIPDGIQPGILYHLVMVRESDEVTFYVNGKQLGDASTGLNDPGGGNASSLTVGTSGDPPTGSMLCLKIIDTALSASEVMAEFARTWADTV